MAAIITTELRDFVKGKLGWVATAGADGTPNVTPKGTIRVFDDNTIIFADLFSLKTRANLLENPLVAVTVVDTEKYVGYQFKGKAELIDSGPIFDLVKEEIANAPGGMPAPKYVAKITVTDIYDQSPGPNAGKKID